MNTFKSTLMLVLLMVVLVLIGERIGGENGMLIAFAISVAMNFTAYFFSDKIALKRYRAQPVTREQLPRAYEVVERLAAKDGLPMPKIYVIPSESPNAFATGRNPQHASVAVTHGILGLLTGAHTTGNPYALASALQKLENYSKRIPLQASASTAHMFIIAPLIGGGVG